MLVEGERSIGKTTLLDALTFSTSTASASAAHAARSPGTNLAYVPLLSGAPRRDRRRRAPDADHHRRGRAAPRHARAFISLVREHAPLALVLDEVDSADGETVAALAYLHRRTADLPVVIVAACTGRIDDLQPTLAPSGSTPLDARGARRRRALRTRRRAPAAPFDAVLDDDPEAGRRARADAPRPMPQTAGRSRTGVLLSASMIDYSPFCPDDLADVLDVDALALVEQLRELCEQRLLVPDGDGFNSATRSSARPFAAR